MNIAKWFTENKWFRKNVKGMKAVYFKKELTTVRVNDSIPINYGIAKRIFEGFFGNSTYVCDELMICYKTVMERPDENEYVKLAGSLNHLGFCLYFATKDDGNYIVGLFADQNVMRYLTDKSLRIGKFNVEALNYIT